MKNWIKGTLFFLGLLTITSCSNSTIRELNSPAITQISANSGVDLSTSTPFQPIIKPTATENVINLYVPVDFQPWIESTLKTNKIQITHENVSNCSITAQIKNKKIGEYIYNLVAPFNTVTDGISRNDLEMILNGENAVGLSNIKIMVTNDDFRILNQVFESNQTNILIVEQDDMLSTAYQSSNFWALIPFDQTLPAWKVLAIEGISPFDQDFDSDGYALTIPLGISCTTTDDQNVLDEINLSFFTNREDSEFTSVLITGTTALTRATGARMELYGNNYPGEDVKQWFDKADISHISNEVSFTITCPHADPNQKDLFFCSRPEYADLFDYLGVDVVELTGNHLVDKGTQPLNDTFDILSNKGIPYYAAGRTIEEAEKAVKFEHNGNRIAFIGCNEAGPNFVWVADQRSGVIRCDFDRMAELVSDLKNEGYLPIVTYQYWETAQFKPMPYQRDDSVQMIEAGAIIVSGSQSHLPMSMEVYKNGFIHYGLGNLFFDQMDIPFPGTRREFLDRHIFYNGKYLGTQLYTAMLEDYAQPRPMTLPERQKLLKDAFVDFQIEY